MNRFILIDQSIVDVGGHHYEYARRVLNSAARAGYTPILAANRKCEIKHIDKVTVHAVYRYGFWCRKLDNPVAAALRRLVGGGRRWVFDQKVSLLLSPIGTLWANRTDALAYFRQSLEITLADRLMLALAMVLLGLFWPFLLLGKGLLARSAFKKCAVRAAGACRACTSCLTRASAAASRRHHELSNWLALRRKRRAFADDTNRLFKAVALDEGDIVIIPTLEENEMLGLLRFLQSEPRSALPTWHLLFRRNIYRGRGPDYRTQDEGQRELRNCFRFFQQRLSRQRVYFYTDTEQLTEQYQRLGVNPFVTLPIPVDASYHKPTQPRSPDDPTRVVYLGDARSEKGYQHLPRLVQDLWPDQVQTGRLQFVLQSNFNTLQGEPQAIVARAQLDGYSDNHVRLLKQPLKSDEYRDLVLHADVVVVPYDRDNYFARSSGIFTEALAAGVPTIVPSGSWMAIQLEDAIRDYHESLVSQTDLVSARVPAESACWARGNKKSSVIQSGQLRLRRGVASRCRLDVPLQSRQLLVSFRLDSDESGAFVSVLMEKGRKGNGLRQQVAVVGGGCDGRHSALLVVPPGSRRIFLEFCGVFSDAPMTLADLRFEFLRHHTELPLSAAGVIYHNPRELSGCVMEILRHRRHYQRTATALSASWAAFHSPDTLIDMLVRRAAGSPRTASKATKTRTWSTPSLDLARNQVNS